MIKNRRKSQFLKFFLKKLHFFLQNKKILLPLHPLYEIKQTFLKVIGVWRSWLAHLLWEQRVLRSSRSTPTKRVIQKYDSFFVLSPLGVSSLRTRPVEDSSRNTAPTSLRIIYQIISSLGHIFMEPELQELYLLKNSPFADRNTSRLRSKKHPLGAE